jgi:hypothetical protein
MDASIRIIFISPILLSHFWGHESKQNSIRKRTLLRTNRDIKRHRGIAFGTDPMARLYHAYAVAFLD